MSYTRAAAVERSKERGGIAKTILHTVRATARRRSRRHSLPPSLSSASLFLLLWGASLPSRGLESATPIFPISQMDEVVNNCQSECLSAWIVSDDEFIRTRSTYARPNSLSDANDLEGQVISQKYLQYFLCSLRPSFRPNRNCNCP